MHHSYRLTPEDLGGDPLRRGLPKYRSAGSGPVVQLTPPMSIPTASSRTFNRMSNRIMAEESPSVRKINEDFCFQKEDAAPLFDMLVK
jgi:hypothetical protein